MRITPLDIQQQKFSVRLRGFDVREVDAFLEKISEDLEDFIRENALLRKELDSVKAENIEFRDREQSFKKAMVSAQEMLEQMKANAEKEGELIISEAQMKAEKILNSVDGRLQQLHVDISELKRQRSQLDVELRSVLEAHARLLNINKDASESADKSEEKLRFFKNP